MEFKNETDVQIAKKMTRTPLLGEKLNSTWNLVLTNEFHMTNHSYLFRTEPGLDRLPLYEGKMIHQFIHTLRPPRYWVNEQEGRTAILGKTPDIGQKLDYQDYRLGFRDVARNTDQRTLISTVIPPAFHGNKLPTVKLLDENGNHLLTDRLQLFLCAILNSFTVDWLLRTKVTTTVNFFYIYQLPVPRLTEQDVAFRMIMERATKLICTTPEFLELWERVMPGSTWSPDVVAIDQAERVRIRAALDGIIAHLYGLSEEEFRHILGTFPLVEQSVKDAALDAYHEFALAPDDFNIAELITKGESDRVEFKVAACWNAHTRAIVREMKDKIVQAVAAFLNKEGGIVLIGVEDNGTIVGLEDDYKAANPQLNKQNRDGYQLFLINTLSDNLGKEFTDFYKISFHTIRGKEVCCIDVQPSNEPVFVRNNSFYVRNGNSKLTLNMKEARAYIKQHWG
jgi:Putative DNA-binding domain